MSGAGSVAGELLSVRDASLFELRETIERTEMGGEACHLVRLVRESGRESFDCYDVETGLAVATIETTETPAGRTQEEAGRGQEAR